jgi:hypothetical protein
MGRGETTAASCRKEDGGRDKREGECGAMLTDELEIGNSWAFSR